MGYALPLPRLMEAVLVGLAREKCIVYLDDISVIGRTLKSTFSGFIAAQAGRAEIQAQEVPSGQAESLLLRICCIQGISADPVKVEAVKSFATPVNVKQFRSFLGRASYYRRFIPCFSRVAAPLFTLTRKDVLFQWDEQCQNSFDILKGLLIQAPLLVFPDLQNSLY